jgi:hypothetical protein
MRFQKPYNHRLKADVKNIKGFLKTEARRLRGDFPPYDPHAAASILGVDVEERHLPDIDGYMEIRDGRYIAVISTKKHPTRQRFTLGHELGHVLLMRFAESESSAPLRKYRSNQVKGLHHDPLEESLCNYFAGELLMPADEVKQRLEKKAVAPRTIFNLANEFNVSTQAAAVNVLKSKGDVIACTLWSLDSLWPLPIWWVGRKTKLLSELRALESLVGKREQLIDRWDSYGEKDVRFKVQIAPTPELRFSMILVAYDDDFELRCYWRKGNRSKG